MPSKAEKLFLGGCEMLLSALHVYGKWTEKGHNPPYWHSENETMLNWLFVQLELAEQPLNEGRSEEFETRIIERQEAISHDLADKYGTSSDHVQYALYVFLIAKLLEKFQILIGAVELNGTPYKQYYLDTISTIQNIVDSVNQSVVAQREILNREIWDKLEEYTSPLVEEWLEQVQLSGR